MSNGLHSKLAPSAAHRWAHCTASVAFIEKLDLPAEDSEYAAEGTRAHETFYTALGLSNPFEVRYGTPEEKEYLPVAIEYVERLRNLYPEADLYRETKVDPAVYLRTRHCKGTADVILPVELGPLYVVDLKFGQHVPVDVIDNLQLIIYGLGALARFQEVEGYTFTEVVLVIIQPRAYHPDGAIREWRMSIDELLDWVPWLQKRTVEALGKNPVFRVGPDEQCRFCPAQGVCRAYAEYSLKQAREVFTEIIDHEAVYKDTEKLTNEELGYLLKQLPAMRRWLTNVSDYALQYLKRGGKIPYYGLKDSLGNRAWGVSPAELELYFDEEILYERKLRSPAQVEKLAGKGSVAELTVREVKGKTIVETDEPAETVETSVFGELPDG